MREPAQLRGERTAAAVLLGGGPVAALAVGAVCLLAPLLAPFGWWNPLVVVPLLVPVGYGVVRLARWVPVRGGPPVPVWSAAASALIAVLFVVWTINTYDQHLVLRRDAGSYALYAQWLATHHGLPVDASLGAFGGVQALSVPGFSLASPAFYQVADGATGAHVVPQFLIGAPALFSTGWWLHGWTGLFAVPCLLGGLMILAAAALTARVVGPRWAPLAALGLALAQPVVHAARTTVSEPAATLLLLGAAALAVDAVDAADPVGPPEAVAAGRLRARRTALLAGALLGLTGLVRVDTVREIALLVPVAAVLWLRRHPAAVPLLTSGIVGIAVAAVPALWLARPYLDTISGSLEPLVAATAGLVALTFAAVAAYRWRERSRGPWRESAVRARVEGVLPWTAALLVVLVGAFLASRPLWQVVRQAPDDPGNLLVASLQEQQFLPIDGSRTYAEQSVTWVVWYVGVPVTVGALLAFAGAAALVVRWWLRSAPGRPGAGSALPPRWLVTGFVGFGSVVITLYRPAITPDHPWADRRLVPVVLPAVVIAATAVAAWAVRWARRRMPAWLLATATLAAVAAVVVPAVQATLPLAFAPTEVDEPLAVSAVCSRLHPGDVVVAVQDAVGGIRAQNEWVQVVRGVCGRPSAGLSPGPDAATSLRRLGDLVHGAGGRLVLLSAAEDGGTAPKALQNLGLQPRRATLVHTTEDQRLLMERPYDRAGLVVDVWLATWH